MATIKLRITVEELSNVMTVYDRIKVYRSTTGKDGVYSEITSVATRIVLVAGTSLYEYIDTSGDPSYWYKYSYFHSVDLTESATSDPIVGEDSGGMYCSVQSLRDAGITETMMSDNAAMDAIMEAGALIEQITSRFFEPRYRRMSFNGSGHDVLFLGAEQPIIEVESIYLVSGKFTARSKTEVSTSDVDVFNRHLREGRIRPDDRDCPMLQFESWQIGYPGIEGMWPMGELNVEVTGYWGYTEVWPGDAVGETEEGSQIPLTRGHTPRLITKVCKMLVARELGGLLNQSDYYDRFLITQEKTADQSYTKASLASYGHVGAWTGDPHIDGILSQFVAPPSVSTPSIGYDQFSSAV